MIHTQDDSLFEESSADSKESTKNKIDIFERAANNQQVAYTPNFNKYFDKYNDEQPVP
jgi:hypothetical protein